MHAPRIAARAPAALPRATAVPGGVAIVGLGRAAQRHAVQPRMPDDYQIDIPPSFFALHTDARRRLSEPLALVRQRYEICEDLANHLTEHAKALNHGSGVAEDEVLVRCHRGLRAEGAGVSPAEAEWIVRRLAELLGWECPAFDAPA